MQLVPRRLTRLNVQALVKIETSFEWLTPQIRSAQARHRRRLEQLFAGQELDTPMAVCGPHFGRSHGLLGNNDTDMLAQPEQWLAEVLADMAGKAELAGDEATFRPLAIELDCLGVHYIDALLGQRAYVQAGQVWAEPFAGDLDELTMPELDRCEVFQASLRLAHLAVEAARPAHGAVLAASPVFSSPINISVNLFRERLLEALISRPAAARRALRIITDVILAACRAFQHAIPQALRCNSVVCTRCTPAGHGYVDGCATQLVSPGHYRDFFAPLDEEILAAYPRGGMIHLCGAHTQHLPAWRQMKPLRSVQINDRATDDFLAYWKGLRADQIVYVSPNAAFEQKRILELTRGRRVVFQCSLSAAV